MARVHALVGVAVCLLAVLIGCKTSDLIGDLAIRESESSQVVKGTPDSYRMPQFRQQHSDQEIADVVTFIRKGWGNQSPAVTAREVANLRKTTDPTSDQVIILKMR